MDEKEKHLPKLRRKMKLFAANSLYPQQKTTRKQQEERMWILWSGKKKTSVSSGSNTDILATGYHYMDTEWSEHTNKQKKNVVETSGGDAS